MNQSITFLVSFLTAYEQAAFYMYCAGMLVFAFQLGYMYRGRFSATNISNSVAVQFWRTTWYWKLISAAMLGQLVPMWVCYQLGFLRLAACLGLSLAIGLVYHSVFVPYIARCRRIAATCGRVTA